MCVRLWGCPALVVFCDSPLRRLLSPGWAGGCRVHRSRVAASRASRLACYMPLREVLAAPVDSKSPRNCASRLALGEECSVGAPGWKDVLSLFVPAPGPTWGEEHGEERRVQDSRYASNSWSLMPSVKMLLQNRPPEIKSMPFPPWWLSW